MSRRLKVLISAYACEPGAGSEPGAGWMWAAAAAEDHDVWLLTRKNNEERITAALRERPELGITPVYIDLPRWASWWKRGQRGVRTYYLLWQGLVWRTGEKLNSEVGFDVGHHLTFAIDSLPAGIAWVDHLPVVWGPVGGSTSTPWWAHRWLGPRGSAKELLRSGLTRPLRRVFGEATARRAGLVVAQNPDVARRFSKASRSVTVEPNCAVDVSTSGHRTRPRHAVLLGRLVPLKGVRLAIAALCHADGWTMSILGDGPERRSLEELVRRRGLGNRVTFHGSVARIEAMAHLEQASLLLFPSFHDAAGWAVAEAAALGTPTLCLDRGGPPLIVRRTGAGRAIDGCLRADMSLARNMEAAVLAGGKIDAASVGYKRLPGLLRGWYSSLVDPSAVVA